MDLFLNISISLIAGAFSGFGLFKLMGSKWIETWFAKDLKRYEHKLDVLKVKDEIRFNILHKERMEIIKNLYKLVSDLNELSLYLIMPTDMQASFNLNNNDLFQRSIILSQKLKTYLLENTIYLPKILEDRIAGLCFSYDSATKSLMRDSSEENKKALDRFNQEGIKPLLNDLRNEFRRLLGVEFDDDLIK